MRPAVALNFLVLHLKFHLIIYAHFIHFSRLLLKFKAIVVFLFEFLFIYIFFYFCIFAFHDYSQEPNFSGFPESRLSKVERAASSPHSNWRGYSLHT